MDENFHLGHMIQAELERQDRTVTWLARRIKCDRTTCYDIFERKFVNLERLAQISIALHHNFFRDLAQYVDTEIVDSAECGKNATEI
ncbi:MAG: XRE family transcriptional regulator [Bacteroidales bacterium]|jgi:hypothetical protein|nr:XRE family transcriptional regulator [Bacteroidales bacterium]MBR4327273.1 XRE family transcriptional regulator [Bacteroidales bacterium]